MTPATKTIRLDLPLRIIQFLEKVTGVVELNISDWRRKTFGDLTAAFRFEAEKAKAPELPDTVSSLNLARYEAAYLPKPKLPGASQQPPIQEQGERRRVPPDRH
jgi:phospholipase C